MYSLCLKLLYRYTVRIRNIILATSEKKEDTGMSQAISFQPVPEFNTKSGEVGASLATLWKKWPADFEMFTTAAGITDNTRKRILLLYQARSRANNAYDTAKAKLTEYFEPQTNRRYDVYYF